ncbi:exosome nuclease subunit RRP6 PWA37_003016 [Arxiozyma heterogenica]|uniref:exosome nuclease subunit RRP6 n=1 Tax=Arxiozyma heterogenica TaxID=278026 RepID=UPI002F236B80
MSSKEQVNNNDNTKEVLSKVVGTVRASNALAAQDIEFYSTLDKDIANSVDHLKNDLLDMINSIIFSIDEHAPTIESGKDQLEGQDWRDYTNFIDNLFERADRSIDILNNSHGINNHHHNNNNSKNFNKLNDGSQFQYLEENINDTNDHFDNKRISKPQLTFKKPVDNSESHPFKPLLIQKPNALKPLEECLKLVDEDTNGNIPSHYPQPYQYEIENQEYNHDILVIKDPIPFKSWNDTEPIWIDQVDQIPHLVQDLSNYKELAIDLEHHDFRSYYGIVCLMQISTRDKDYLIDTIALRDDLSPLNKIFTNPMITKVFHGAFMDIIWLQRDLGLYIVSLFDTYHASKALGFPKHSLAYLLETFVNFKTSKKYQLADWRRRPLSKPLLAYARADTHFLLNIFDQLRNELIKQNKLASVLKESREVAKRRFEYSKYRPKINIPTVYSPIEKIDPWRTLMYQYNVPLEKEQLVKELYIWRDTMARRDDESPRYIMPNQLLISLVAYTPIDAAGVVSVNTFITDTVRSNSKQIANMIKNYLTSVKSNNNNSSITSMNNISIVPDQVTKTDILTLSQVRNMFVQFNGLEKKYSEEAIEKTKDNKDIIGMNQSKFLGQLTNNKHIISYKENNPKIVPETVLQSRHEAFIKLIDESNKVEYTIPVPNEEMSFATTDTSAIESSTNIDVIPSIVTEEKEDMNEIVVLKKVKRDSTNSRKKNEHKSENEEPIKIIDYSKEKKVLSSKRVSEEDDNSKKKKRKFDPFSQIHETVKAAKKRKNITKGRNVSFKR